MRAILRIFIIIASPLLAMAQLDQRQADSLHLLLLKAPNDTIRMQRYYALGWAYLEINHDSALLYFEKALPLARNLQLKLNEADILGLQGYLFQKTGNYARSLETHLLAIKIGSDPANENKLWPNDMTRLEKLAWNYHHLYGIYDRTGNLGKAIESLQESRRIAVSQNNNVIQAFVNTHLGELYIKTGQLDSALILEENALEFFSASKFWSNYQGAILNYIGKIYLKQGDFAAAHQTLLRASRISTQRNNINSLGDSFFLLAQLYKRMSIADSCLLFARKAHYTYQVLKNSLNQGECLSLMASAHEELLQKDSALHYFKMALAITDSLKSVEVKNLLAFQNVGFEEQQRLETLEKERATYESKIRTNTLLGILFAVIIVALFLYRNNKQKQRAKQNIEKAYEQLKATQTQLIQSEKMASLGELTAGIAHEIQNPLNFVNNFSEVNAELVSDLEKAASEGNLQEVRSIAKDLKENEEKIVQHGKRADGIVKSMLQHSRRSTGQKELTDINALCDEYLRLAFHGLRAKDKSFNARFETNFDATLPKINIVPQEMGRVILNLINNAFYAVNERLRHAQPDTRYEPKVMASTKNLGDKIEIRISDNGTGIPEQVKEKIFQPFFTTKPTGQGTGLGLSLSYDIVKSHGGVLKAETKESEGSEFVILLPEH